MNEVWAIVVPDVRRDAYAGYIDIKKEIAITTNYLKVNNSIPALAVSSQIHRHIDEGGAAARCT